MKRDLSYALPVLSLAPFLLFVPGNYYGSKFLVLTLVLFFVLSLYVGEKIHWTVGLFMFYCVAVSALRWAGVWKFNTGNAPQFMAHWFMTFACLEFSLLLLVLAIMNRCHHEIIMLLMPVGVVLNSLFVIITWGGGGVLGEPSMSACVNALFIPMMLEILKGKWKALVLIPLSAVVVSMSTSPILILCIVLGSYALANRAHVSWFVAAVVVSISLGAVFNPGFLNESSRITEQLRLIDWYVERVSMKNLFFGTGIGSVAVITQGAQMSMGETSRVWFHLHSDLLRCVLENGIVGTLLTIPVAVTAAIRSWREPWLFATVMGVMAWMVGQYPSSLPFHGALCAVVITLAVRNETEATN